MQSKYQQSLRQKYRASLETDCSPRVITQVLNVQHRGVCQRRRPRKEPFEISEERRIVERPFGSGLRVPLLDREGVSECQPIAMHLKVRGLAAGLLT